MSKLIVLFSLIFAVLRIEAVDEAKTQWWKDQFIYQIYPRSFKDSNGDGVGDLNGITEKLVHLTDLGVKALWISPIYKSPMVDFGYDISNFTDIDPIFGNLRDFTRLTENAKALGLKVILDFVPNHTSDLHPWFKSSIERIKPYDEYFIWRDAKIVNGTRTPPNNWLSVFGGSAWEYNAERGQYYFHEFVIGQPDLNYRSTALQLEMQKVLIFWLDRGVDGFRIDALNFLIEDSRFLDEPEVAGTNLPVDDPDRLVHVYTRDQNETYLVLKSWRKLVDDYAKETRTDTKILLTEAYSSLPDTMKYYEYGSDVPFNFMFVADLTNSSNAADFKRAIQSWLDEMPEGSSANWVSGNHDQHRVASRFGTERADQLSMLAAVLPGVGIIYNGDEIGMEDTWLSYEDTIDPWGCNLGPDRYHLKSRDPERTPYQWNASVSAGFSTSNRTWLPVHPNYRVLNLAAQKLARLSHYSIFKRLVLLKKQWFMVNGTLEITLVNANVLSVIRRYPPLPPVVLLINFSSSNVRFDANSLLKIPEYLWVFEQSVHSGIPDGSVNTKYLNLPGAASVILW